MCMSEVTEWDTPLQQHQWKSREMSTGLLKPSSGQPPPLRHTFWRQYPFQVSQPALFSSHPIPSASAPLFFCAARDLCRRDAGTERWRMGKASELGGEGDAKKKWKHSHRFLRLIILPCSRCRFLRLPELVNGLSFLLQLRKILPADLLSTKTTFLSSQLQRDAAFVEF